MTDFKNSVLPRNVEVFHDRRQPTDLDALSNLIERLMERIDNLDQKLTTHMSTEPGEIKKVIEDTMNASFPEGDAAGHLRAHQAWIKKAEESAQFWKEMRVAVAKWAGLGLLAFLTVAAWHEFLKGPK